MDKFFLDALFKADGELNEDGSINILGYASTTDLDRQGDVIKADAWTVNGGLNNFQLNPILLFNHNYNRPIGRAIDINVDAKGLAIKAKISNVAEDIVGLIKDGVLGAFSVGFRVRDADYDSETDIFVIKEAELLEVSVVSIPANQAATFSVSKAFTDETELKVFKETYNKSGNNTPEELTGTPVSKEKKTMDPEELEAIVKKAAADAVEASQKAEAVRRAEEKAANEKADKDAEDKKAADKVQAETIITAGISGAEKLVSDLEARLALQNEDFQKVIDEMKSDIDEKSEEIVKIRDSKRIFKGAGSDDWREKFSEEIDDAYLLGIMTKKGFDTKYGNELREKVNTWSGVGVSSADYEQTVSTNLERDIQLGLVMAPLFREIQMNSATMILPIMPDAGYAEWTANQVGSGSAPHGNLAERGDTYGSAYGGIDLTERTLSTKKLISVSYHSRETEEDAILPILPLIRESMVRSHQRAMENMILAGNHADGAFGTGGASPNGLIHMANADSDRTIPAGNFAAADKITAANLLTTRIAMGKYGVNPSDVIHIVSLDVYYNLIEDAEFQDVNLVGDKATKLSGEIGSVYGSKVLVCPEFATKAASKYCVMSVNTRNFVLPRLRGFTVESDYETGNQRTVLVVSQRIGFLDIIDAATSKWGYTWKAV